MIKRLIFLILLAEILFAQVSRDPRCMSLAGTYSTVSRGVYAVGWNPANLMWNDEVKFTMNLSSLKFCFSNSAFSLSDVNRYNGLDLEQINPYTNASYKTEFLALFPDDGWNFYSGISYKLPGISFSKNNIAFSSDVVVISDGTIPKGIIDIIFNGNTINKDFDMTAQLELMGLAKHSFAMALPIDYGAMGFSVNYLQGLYYIGLDPDSSEMIFRTDTSMVNADGHYLMRKTYGGNGLGLDIGYSSPKMSGWQFSIALNNLLSRIEWNKPTYTYNFISGLGFHIKQAEYVRYWYKIENLGATDILDTGTPDSTGRDVTNIFVRGDSLLAPETNTFYVKYPTIFRMGFSKELNEEILLVMDLSTGFEDRFFAKARWLWSSGLEIKRSPSFPVRVGLAYGGRDYREMSFGFGIHWGILAFDYGMAFHDGFKLTTAKGVEMALGLHLER